MDSPVFLRVGLIPLFFTTFHLCKNSFMVQSFGVILQLLLWTWLLWSSFYLSHWTSTQFVFLSNSPLPNQSAHLRQNPNYLIKLNPLLKLTPHFLFPYLLLLSSLYHLQSSSTLSMKLISLAMFLFEVSLHLQNPFSPNIFSMLDRHLSPP